VEAASGLSDAVELLGSIATLKICVELMDSYSFTAHSKSLCETNLNTLCFFKAPVENVDCEVFGGKSWSNPSGEKPSLGHTFRNLQPAYKIGNPQVQIRILVNELIEHPELRTRDWSSNN
jgi:hypothetical protein